MKSMKKALALGLALAMAVTAVPVTDAQAATTAKLNKSSVTVAVGSDKEQVKEVKVTTPSTWKSVKVTSKSNRASVARTGVSGKTIRVRAKKKGTTTVTVTVTGKKNSQKVSKKLTLNVKVVNSGARFVQADGTTTLTDITVVAGETATAKLKLCPATDAVPTYTSNDTTVATVDSNGVITGVTAGSNTTITATTNYGNSATLNVTVIPATPVITSVTATNATTISLAGKNLGLLTINDIKVAGYTATSITPSEDGTTATVALGSALVPDQETTVTITIDGVATDYSVKYSVNASGVAVKDGTYSSTAGDKYLTVLVNGVETSVSELVTNGYSVTFYAYKEDATGTLQVNNTLLDGDSGSGNTSGKLVSTPTVGEYKVKVVLVKNGETITSEYATIKITDKEAYETEIKTLTLKDKASTAVFLYELSGSSLEVHVGDVFELTKLVTVNSYGSDDAISSANLAKVIVSSADTAIATASGQTITTHKQGTTKLTFTYGSLTKEVTLTVKTDGRGFSKIQVASWAPSSVLQGSNVTVPVYAIDNYGAYMIGQYVYVNLGSTNTAVDGGKYDVQTTGTFPGSITNINAKSEQTGTDGCVYLVFTATNNASAQATFEFYKGVASNKKEGSLLTTYHVTTAAKTNTNYKLELVKAVENSADAMIDYNPLSYDGKIVLNLNKYYGTLYDSTVSDMKTDSVISGCAISFDDSVISVKENSTTGAAITKDTKLSSASASVTCLVIEPTGKAGTTTITLKNATQQTVASFAVTTENSVPKVEDIGLSVSSISHDVYSTVDYRNLFSIVTSVDNPELQKVTITNNPKGYSKVRLCTNATTAGNAWKMSASGWANSALTAGDLYFETSAGNLCIGSLQMKLTVGGSYQAVTSPLAIPENTNTSIVFGIIDYNNTSVINVLNSSIAVNSYK